MQNKIRIMGIKDTSVHFQFGFSDERLSNPHCTGTEFPSRDASCSSQILNCHLCTQMFLE